MTRVPALLLLSTLVACERPFVDAKQPDVVILSPDLSVVLQQPRFDLRLRVGSFRHIDAVSVNGIAMQYDNNDHTWSLPLSASRGLNRFIIEASDTQGITSIDTAYALHLPAQFVANSPPLPAGRGNHTTTRTHDQELLVIGGASQVSGPAHPTLYTMASGGNEFVASTTQLVHPRSGHTATLLADGRILVIGGSRTNNIGSVADLVETPEVYDPSTRSFREWKVIGDPIRRALHTAVYRRITQGEFVDLYGGLGDTRYGSEPYLGVRPDLRTFRILNDTLRAENSLATAPYPGSAIYGHTVNRITIGPYFVFGGRFESQFQQDVSFSIEYTPRGIRIQDVPALKVVRTQHAATPLLQDLLLITGGRQYLASSVVSETEVYSHASNKVFRFSGTPPVYARFGHTTTTTESGAVLVLGGFGPDGTALSASEFFAVTPESPLH